MDARTHGFTETYNDEIQPVAGVTPYRLAGSAHVGKVRLVVSDLERSLAFYSQVIGLTVLNKAGSLAQLGAGGDVSGVLLELEQRPGVKPIGARSGRGGRLGLYHTAFLLPAREDFSSFVQHLLRHKVPFAAGDHFVSEALYLVDPDGLEVEVYADRPRSQWQRIGSQLRMGTAEVRFHELPKVAADSWRGAPAGTTVGHVHFYVGDLEAAREFYCKALGLDVMVEIPTALFTSAGGYHHHVGLNVWQAGSPVATAEDARLLSWELVLPDTAAVTRTARHLLESGYGETIRAGGARVFADPWGIQLALIPASETILQPHPEES